ncbi:MAG: 3-hydroxyacyl-CoA dehydrogenase NAD-binding domain-containing protein, partial [Pseudomonadota bacterium]|nr:3-hydroxyacyl-CoA dehydrogenase NAD-binding domain-containing protein [Pseudomonadota bacterium]
MNNSINSVAVLGSGTMGAGIAALCLEKGLKVLLLDVTEDAVMKGSQIISDEKNKMLSSKDFISNLETGVFSKDFSKISDFDWICEAVIENVKIKKEIFSKIEEHRKAGSIVSSNTSGIPLRDIVEGMPNTMLNDVCITHFFNPVKVMKLCELIPSEY